MRMIYRACVLGGLIGLASGCSIAAEDTGEAEQPIIFGEEVKECDRALAAVGAVVFHFFDPEYPEYGEFDDFFCSATLIAPKVALTARHCVETWYFDPEPAFSNYVTFGQDAYAPEHKAKITSFLAAPPGPAGLLNDGGRDIAVLYLDKAPKGIKPAQLGKFKTSMLGKKFRIAGFGQTEEFTAGIKYEGKATARALSGDWYPLLFNNDYEAFDEWYWTDASLASGTPEEEAAWWAPGTFALEPGYELLAGGLPGEQVSCWGDSGGPLLQGKTAKELTVYGVSFAGEGSIATNCALGGGYAVLNDEMLNWVKAAVKAAP